MKSSSGYLLVFLLTLLFVIFIHEAFTQALQEEIKESNGFNLVPKEYNDPVPDSLIRTAFLNSLSYEMTDAECRSAFDYLKNSREISCTYITFKEIQKHPNILDHYDVIWFHRPDSTAFNKIETNPKVLQGLREYISSGGNLFLTLEAFHYIGNLGLETEMPDDSLKPSIDEGYGRKLGFHAFRDHPVFENMNGGAYIFLPVKDMNTRITGYFGDKLPKNGKVVAVDWDYIFLRENSKMILEYSFGKGKVIASGGYTWYSLPNYNRDHLELFTRNVIRYLSNHTSNKTIKYWEYAPLAVDSCKTTIPDPVAERLPFPDSHHWQVENDPLMLENRFASFNYWDLAGERMLTMGKETGGIEEVWAHPFMALRDYKVGIKFDYRDTIFWLDDEKPEIAINPAFFKRVYKFPRAYLTEIIVNDPTEPAGTIHYEYKGVYKASLYIQFSTTLRLMWPYSEKVTGSICHSWNPDYNAFIFKDKSGDHSVVVGGNRRPLNAASGQFSGFDYLLAGPEIKGIPTQDFRAAASLKYPLREVDFLDIVYSASNEGSDASLTSFGKAVQNPHKIYEDAVSHTAQLLQKHLMITSPDPGFNAGYAWSMIASDRFFVNTPGMGKSLVAGYSTTKRGWDGGHRINGRPGYGWYFGRDGEWSGFALLDYGDFAKVRSILDFYNKYQDLSGKIFHEATTSGVIHYDAADATPLYIVLAGKYFRHTGDTAFLRKTWPNIKKALDFCISTDTDGDHLIENTNVGHGWVEGGELYGSHATLYLNACWAAGLEEAFTMASSLGQQDAESYRQEAGIIRDIINSSFWNSISNFYAYGKNKDGKFRNEPTVLPAVPLYFRLAEPEKAKSVLKQLASNQFSTNWGTRIVREESPLFNPRGYHYGSVWPLFTGWTALAEYQYGHFNQGFSHIMNNLNVYKNWGLGFVEEVLNGAVYLPSGVCPHQCWSETMVLQPAIEGMLGLSVNARENRIRLAPHLPACWDSLKADNIRMGSQVLNFRMDRTPGKYIYYFSPGDGRKTNVEFAPSFPAGTVFKSVLMDGKEIPFAAFQTPDNTSLVVKFSLIENSSLEIVYEKGISVLPVIQDPKPGYPAEGLRIISSRLNGNQYAIEVEGKSGTSEEIKVYLNGQEIERIENGEIIERQDPFTWVRATFDKNGIKYNRKSVTIFLK